jgi:predicted TIM-barrel fold metal-dependent hydrolase
VRDRVADTVGRDRVVGVRLGDADLTGATDAFFEAMAAHGGQVHLQISADGLPTAAERIADHPGVTFVFDHLGPFGDDPDAPTAAEVGEHSNAHVKITHTSSGRDSRYPFPEIHDQVRGLYEAFGPDRLLWGSDYVYHFKKVVPWQTLEFVDELPFLSSGDRRKLLGDNAAKLLS